VILLALPVIAGMVLGRFFEWLQERRLSIPVILHYDYDCAPEDFIIRASAECGAMLCDGLGDGVCLNGPYPREFYAHSASLFCRLRDGERLGQILFRVQAAAELYSTCRM